MNPTPNRTKTTPDKIVLRYPLLEVSPFFELARVLVRFDHVASFIINANHTIV